MGVVTQDGRGTAARVGGRGKGIGRNASGVTGLAGKRSDELAERGVSVLAMGNATDRESSVVVQITKEPKPGTKAALEKKFGVITTTDTAAYPDAKGYTADFVIILGVKNAGSSTSDSSN